MTRGGVRMTRGGGVTKRCSLEMKRVGDVMTKGGAGTKTGGVPAERNGGE